MPPPPLPHLDEHRSAAPKFSPSLVENEEGLLRTMFDPEHIKDGKLTRRAIGVKDLLSRGFSVHRMRYTSPDFIKDTIQSQTSKPKSDGSFWEDAGVAVLKAGFVRILQYKQEYREQVFRVTDTALEDNEGHASIYVAFPKRGQFPKRGPAYARKMRKLLLPFLQIRMSVDEAFQRHSN